MVPRSPTVRRIAFALLALTAAAGLGLYVARRADGARATRDLATALRRLPAPEGLGAWPDIDDPSIVSALAARLDSDAAEAPTPHAHTAASHVRHALGDLDAAARHAEFAARLAPDDAALAARRDALWNAALVARAADGVRPFALVAALVMAVLLARGAVGRRHRIARERIARSLAVRASFVADGEHVVPGRSLPRTSDLSIDVHVAGLASLRRPGPRLDLVLSNAGSSRTIRLRPIHDLHHDATRVPLRPSTTSVLFAEPGPWRLHLSLDGHDAAFVPIDVPPHASGGRSRIAARGFA